MQLYTMGVSQEVARSGWVGWEVTMHMHTMLLLNTVAVSHILTHLK
jgi:hypothetical protein